MMKIPFLTLSITTLIVALFVVFGSAPDHLTWFSQDGLQQPFRLFSAHFVHSDIEHLTWNTGAFFLLGSIIEQFSRRDLVLSIFVGIMSVNVYLLLLYDLNAYVGLSGVLNSVLIAVLFTLSKQQGYQTATNSILVLSMLKIIFELYSDQSLFSSISWPAVPEAHLFGWLAGVMLIVVRSLFHINKQSIYKISYSKLNLNT